MGAVPNSNEGSGSVATLQNIVKSWIGAGTLALPFVWMEGGLVLSTAVFMLLALVALWAIYKLVECSDLVLMMEARQRMVTRIKRGRNNMEPALPFETIDDVTDDDILPEDMMGITTPSYAEVGNAAFGPIGGHLVNAAIGICQIGILIAYIVFISTNFYESIGLSRQMWVAIQFIPLLGLIMIPNVGKLAPAAVAGNIVYLLTIALIMYYGAANECCIPPEDINWSNISAFPLIFGTCSFALEGIVMVTFIRAEMKDKKKFPFVMNLSILTIGGLYLFFAIGSYIFFGELTQSPMIASLSDGVITKLAKIALSLSILFSFPFQIYPITTFFDKIIDHRERLYHQQQYQQHQLGDNDPLAQLPSTNDLPPVTADISSGSRPSIHPSDSTSSVGINSSLGHSHQSIISSHYTYDEDGNPITTQPFTEGGEIQYEAATSFVGSIAETALFNDMPPRKQSLLLKFTFRLVVLGLVSIVGLVFPDFKLIISLFGALATSALAFVFPSAFWFQMCTTEPLYGIKCCRYDRAGRPIDILQAITATYQNNQTISRKRLGGNGSQLKTSSSTTALDHATAEIGGGPALTQSHSAIGIPTAAADDSLSSIETDYMLSGGSHGRISHNTILSTTSKRNTPYSDDHQHNLHTSSSAEHIILESEHGNEINTVADAYNDELKLRAQYDGMIRQPTLAYRLKWLLLPATVGTVGVIASVIGIYDAIKSIVKTIRGDDDE